MARAQVFDEEALAAAGVRVIRRAGWPAVTMRSVAEELGVSPMALYRLAPDADRLRLLVADAAAPRTSDVAQVGAGVRRAAARAVGTRSAGAGAGGGSGSVLRAWALEAYGHLRRHPGLSSYVVLHWTELPAWLDVVESLLATVEEDGLPAARAVAPVNAVFAFVLVRAQLHDGLVAAPGRALAPLQEWPDRYPLLDRNQAEFARAQTDRHFRFGLDALVAGLGLARER